MPRSDSRHRTNCLHLRRRWLALAMTIGLVSTTLLVLLRTLHAQVPLLTTGRLDSLLAHHRAAWAGRVVDVAYPMNSCGFGCPNLQVPLPGEKPIEPPMQVMPIDGKLNVLVPREPAIVDSLLGLLTGQSTTMPITHLHGRTEAYRVRILAHTQYFDHRADHQPPVPYDAVLVDARLPPGLPGWAVGGS